MPKKLTNKLPVAKAVPYPTTSNKAYEASERKYNAEDGLRALERAEEVKRDKGLMKDVKQLAKSKIKDLGKIR